MSTRVQLRIRAVPNAIPRSVDDEVEGERLVEWVQRAVDRGRAPPAAVILRPERTEIVAIGPAVKAGVPFPRLMGSLARSTVDDAGLPYAVGLIGVVQLRRRATPGQTAPPPVPMAVAFVEWPDNRWWYWRALVEPQGGGLRPDTESVSRAVEGDPMPGAFGRWWALARRANLRIHLTRNGPTLPDDPSQIVH